MHGVKLYLYEFTSEKTYIEAIEAKNFESFLIVSLKHSETLSPEGIEQLAHQFKAAFPDKKVLLIPDNLDISFYGVMLDDS